MVLLYGHIQRKRVHRAGWKDTPLFHLGRSKGKTPQEPSGGNPCFSGTGKKQLDCTQETGTWQTGGNYVKHSFS